MPYGAPPPIDTYAIYVGFDQIQTKADFDQIQTQKEREYFLNLPTTFHLEKEAIDKLRAVGPRILEQSTSFRDLCSALKCHE
jgi:NTE family protein